MTELLDKNLKFLDEKYPGIQKLIEDKRDELLGQEDLVISVEKDLEGQEILKVKKEDRNLYLGGKRSARTPAINQIQALGKIEYSAPIFMAGLGNICYLEELVKSTNTSNAIFLYEPVFSVFYTLVNQVDFKKIFQNRLIMLLIGGINDEDNLKPLMDTFIQGDRVPIMKHFILPNYKEICLEKILRFQKDLTEVANAYSCGMHTKRFFHNIFVDNLFHNANYVRTGYQAYQLTDVLPKDEVPAIVVSAGPSLNKNIETLKKAKNKAFIIAVDTAIKPLVSHGIVPDMYAIVDGVKPLELVEVEESRYIPLITTLQASKAILEYHKGKKFFFCEGIKFIDEMYEKNKKTFFMLASGGSVATLAFSLVSYVGFRTVILVGQDLALTGNKTHADGTFKEKMDELDTSKCTMVPGNVEEKVPTRGDFNNYRIWFEEFIERWSKKYKDFRVINATEGGARIKGTEIMTLEDVVKQECKKEVDIAACMEQLQPSFNQKEQQDILEYLQNTPKEFHEIAKLAKTGKNLYIKLDKLTRNGNTDSNAYEKVLNQVKKNTKKIEKNKDYQLVEECLNVANQIMRTGQYREYQSFEEECKDIADQGMQYMDLVYECSEMLEEFSRNIFDKIED